MRTFFNTDVNVDAN